MNNQVLGLACLASLSATPALAMQTDLQLSDDGKGRTGASVELLNVQNTYGVTRHDDVTAHGVGHLRWYDIGVRLDGYMAIDAKPSAPEVTALETTQFDARLDYLFDVEGYVQVIPFFKATFFPHITGQSAYNLLGIDMWYLLPVQGWEIGGSAAYNLYDGTDPDHNTHHWIGTVGTRYLYQDAPLDLMFWGLGTLGSRSFHQVTSGANKQGLTTIDIGAKATLPLPWNEMWSFLTVQTIWWVSKDDRDSIKAGGRDPSEVIIGVGIEYRSE